MRAYETIAILGAALGWACTPGGADDEGPTTGAASGIASDGTTQADGSGETQAGETSSSGGLDDTFGCPLETYYPDADDDGYGDEAYPVDACIVPPAHVEVGGDCDDTNPDVHPGVEELCDGFDNDCNGLFDELSPVNTSCQGCNLGLMGTHAYYYCPQPQARDRARAMCMQWSADLVQIEDEAEQAWLLGEPLPGAAVYYLGLNDIEIEGTFVWPDGSAPGFTAWGEGEPNDALEGEDCVQLAVATAAWNDIDCATAGAFICEAIGG